MPIECPSRRQKGTLSPGYSQLHWLQFCQSNSDLSGSCRRSKIPLAEINCHKTESDCWSVLNGKVYNITPYLKYHPGGIPDLLLAAGGDCTALFNEHHPWVNGHNILEKCYLGELDRNSVKDQNQMDSSRFALHETQWRSFELIMKQQTKSEDTVTLTFQLPKKKVLGLTIPGQHLKVRATIHGQVIERPYTPMSKLSQLAAFDLVVKIYPDGVMSPYLDKLAIGDSVEMLGPQGRIGYPEAGIVTIGGQVQLAHVRHIVMIAAGTGITPMMQLIRAMLENSNDTTKFTLVNCNHSLAHIIACSQLEPLANMFVERVKIHHVLHKKSEDDARELRSYQTGKRLDKTMLTELVPTVSPHVAVFHCGPPAFDEDVSRMLKDIGFHDNQVFMF